MVKSVKQSSTSATVEVTPVTEDIVNTEYVKKVEKVKKHQVGNSREQ